MAEPPGQGDDRLAGLQLLGGVEVTQGMVTVLPGGLPDAGSVRGALLQRGDDAGLGQGGLQT